MSPDEYCDGREGGTPRWESTCCGPERGPQVEGFTIPCLLLLLSEKPGHGYDLVDRLGAEFGLSQVDPAGVYRNLRRLEADGFLKSAWETGGAGPARKTYEVTPDGRELLNFWATALWRNSRVLQHFLGRHQSLAQPEGGEADA